MTEPRKLLGVDLFSGVGGMSLGFEQAGFDVMGAFDVEDRHVQTYQRNLTKTPAFALDLSKATGTDIRQLMGIGRSRIDVLFGGPPCQGFSVGGRRQRNDPRNSLLKHFARLVAELRPLYFVLENVEGLMLEHAKTAFNRFKESTSESGYQIIEPVQVLDAADFGVPQRRRRTIVLGYRDGAKKPSYPVPSGLRTPHGGIVYPKVKDAISDLPDVDQLQHLFQTDEVELSTEVRSYYAKLMRGDCVDPEDLSPHRDRKPEALTGCLRTHHSKETVLRFRKTPPGSAESISRYIRLDLEDVAPTLRAGTGNDHGSHTAPRPIHPVRPRCITVREAARLHSFPDWFQFHPTRWHAFRQIGNSVPPLLARKVAYELRRVL